MRRSRWLVALAGSVLASASIGGSLAGGEIDPPTALDSGGGVSAFSAAALTLQQQPESIYAPPEPPHEDQGLNEGAVHLDLTISYMTDYVYRGIDFSEISGDAPNLQFDGKLTFDLGKLPHPFIALFVNVNDSDPVSHFEIVQPTVGFDWPLKPLVFSAGNTTYIYPERDNLNTSEVFGQIMLDDSFLWSSPKPLLSPYIFAAYDYDKYNGWYLQAGVKHDLVIEGTGATLTFLADIAYVSGEQLYLERGSNDSGLQHYDLGVIGSYLLNPLLNIPGRYGEFSIQGQLWYTDGIDNHLRADTLWWGGGGINFKY